MSLEEIVIKLAPYNIACKTVEGYFLVSLTFDKDWQVVKPDNTNVECGIRKGICYYSTPISETGIQEIFDSINETIRYNENLAKKLELFEVKMKEMQDLFTDEDIETLKTLTFKLKRPKKSVKKQDPQVMEKTGSISTPPTTDKETACEQKTENSQQIFSEDNTEEVLYQEISEEPTDNGDSTEADALIDQLTS